MHICIPCDEHHGVPICICVFSFTLAAHFFMGKFQPFGLNESARNIDIVKMLRETHFTIDSQLFSIQLNLNMQKITRNEKETSSTTATTMTTTKKTKKKKMTRINKGRRKKEKKKTKYASEQCLVQLLL